MGHRIASARGPGADHRGRPADPPAPHAVARRWVRRRVGLDRDGRADDGRRDRARRGHPRPRSARPGRGEALKMLAPSPGPGDHRHRPRRRAETIRLLNAGADDYLVKPFTPPTSRPGCAPYCAAARGGRRTAGPCSSAGCQSTPRPRRPSWTAPPGPDPREFDLLAFLAGGAGGSSRRRELLAEVWQQAVRRPTRPSTSTCPGCAANSARPPPEPRYLHTLRGVGVRLAAPDEPA